MTILIIIILERFNRFVGIKPFRPASSDQGFLYRAGDRCTRVLKYITACFIGLVAMILALISATLSEASDAIYRVGGAVISDDISSTDPD